MSATAKNVFSGSADYLVYTFLARDCVETGATEDHIVAGFSKCSVITVASVEKVVSSASCQGVIAQLANEHVGPVFSKHAIEAIATEK